MSLIETEGLVLRCYNLSDADKIVVALTEKEGLIRGTAKGAKRLKSKFGGSLEPFSIVRLVYLKKEEIELVSIRDIELLKSYFLSAANPDFLQKFSYIADLLYKFVPLYEPNKRIYNMSKICLKTGANKFNDLNSIVLYFEYWILKLSGFLPSWEKCVKCGENFSQEQEGKLQIDFNLMCDNCADNRAVQNITNTERNLFDEISKTAPLKFINRSNSKEKEVFNLSEILKRIIAQVLDKESVGETKLKLLNVSINE